MVNNDWVSWCPIQYMTSLVTSPPGYWMVSLWWTRTKVLWWYLRYMAAGTHQYHGWLLQLSNDAVMLSYMIAEDWEIERVRVRECGWESEKRDYIGMSEWKKEHMGVNERESANGRKSQSERYKERERETQKEWEGVGERVSGWALGRIRMRAERKRYWDNIRVSGRERVGKRKTEVIM